MTPVEQLDDLKDHLDALDNFWSDEMLWRRLHAANDELVRIIARESPSYFARSTLLSLTSGTATYDLPLNARLGSRIIFAENRIDGASTELTPTALRNLMDSSPASVMSIHSRYQFSMEGEQVRVIPTPTETIADSVRVYYVPSFGNMLQGRVSAATTTTLTAYTSAPNYTSNYGKVDRRDDYYNDMKIEIVDGTGVGQEREVVDWDGTNRQFTMSAWTTVPDTTSVFCVKCPLPEGHHNVPPLLAAMHAAIKGRTRLKEIRQVYHGSPGLPGALDELLTWIQKRQDARGQSVQPYGIGDN